MAERPDSEIRSEPAAEPEAGDGAPNTPAGAPTEVEGESAAEEIRLLKAERDQMNDQLLRALADFDNFRKRTQRELAEQRLYGMMEAFRALLPALDGVDRALRVEGGSVADLRKGLEMLSRQLTESVKKLGVEPIEAAGRPFDPHLHEAVEMVETNAAPEHTVVQELQRGYKLRDKLVRPAMVRVAQSPRSDADKNGR